jgi:hypothetical protein
MGPENTLSRSKDPATGPYPKPDKSSPQPHTPFINNCSISGHFIHHAFLFYLALASIKPTPS